MLSPRNPHQKPWLQPRGKLSLETHTKNHGLSSLGTNDPPNQQQPHHHRQPSLLSSKTKLSVATNLILREMGEASGKIDVEKLILYSDDLVGFLKDKKDLNNLEHSLQHSKALRSSCDANFNEVQNLLQDYEKKIDACKQKTKVAYLEVVADEEIDLLQRELDGVIETKSLFMEELR